MNNGILYAIINKVNGKMYIGQSLNSFNRRYAGNWIKKTHNDHLRSAVNKYGEDSFIVLTICKGLLDVELLNCLEYELVIEYNLTDREKGYNKRDGGRNGRLTEEAKRRISKAVSGKNHNMYGKKFTLERRMKQSASLKGRVITEEHRKKLSEAKKGSILSEETKQKISKASKGERNGFYGKKHDSETKERIKNKLNELYANGYVNPRKNVILSDETKKKIAKAKAEAVGVPILVTFADGTVKEFSTKVEAFKTLGISKGKLNYWLNRGIPEKYKNEYIKIEENRGKDI